MNELDKEALEDEVLGMTIVTEPRSSTHRHTKKKIVGVIMKPTPTLGKRTDM